MNRRTIRVSDDQGHTQRAMRPTDPPALNAEDWASMSVLHGVTGEPVGRPRLGEDQLSAAGLRKRRYRDHQKPTLTPFAGRTSTPDDWARERFEREQATARAEAQRRARHGDRDALPNLMVDDWSDD